MSDSPMQEIEEAVIDAWPAAECEPLGGWWLRASGGLTRRANSVATVRDAHEPSAGNPQDDAAADEEDAQETAGLDKRIEQAEAFYAARALPAQFQVGPEARPRGLDDVLAARGYRVEGEAECMVATPADALSRLRRGHEVSVGSEPTAPWLAHAAGGGRMLEHRASFEGILARLGTRCRCATARNLSGEVIGTTLGITSEQRLGIYAMMVSPVARRRGAGSAMLRALCEVALAEQLSELYLLVELDNAPARALYDRAGFLPLYRYHYRVNAAGP